MIVLSFYSTNLSSLYIHSYTIKRNYILRKVLEESLSQEVSVSAKRARKYSIIKDPIFLTREKIIQT
jgi:hypothetical protein